MGCGASSAKDAATRPLSVTADQKQLALRRAAAEQQLVYDQAEQWVISGGTISAEEFSGDGIGVAWRWRSGRDFQLYGGPALEAMMATVNLIDARYLLSLARFGGVLPRGQDVPASAVIAPSSAWRLRMWSAFRCFSLPVLVLSYPWLDKDHPDKNGALLRQIVPVLQAMLWIEEGEVTSGDMPLHHMTVGVMLDYCSLPQHPRTAKEQERFDDGLRSMHLWYAHPFTHVLLVTTPLPSGEHGNSRTYEERGWCFFELHMSALVKNADVLWDLSGLPTHSRGFLTYEACRVAMRAGRQPPLSPPRLEAVLRERVQAGTLSFSYMSDLEPVLAMYRRGFIEAFVGYRQLRGQPTTTSIYYGDLGWGSAEAVELAATFRFICSFCEILDGHIEINLNGNAFPYESRQQMFEAVDGRRGNAKLQLVGLSWE